jgi:hypothetical protein
MTKLSYTQEYYLCATNDKGNPKSLGFDAGIACLLVGGVEEMIKQGFIVRAQEKRLLIVRLWDDSLPHLKPLYEALVSFSSPKSIKRVAASYLLGSNYWLPDKLGSAIGASLIAANCVDKLPDQGLLKNKTKYVPKPEVVAQLIERLRTEFLEDGALTDETLCLAAFLDRSGLIRKHFGEAEKETLERRLKEVRRSDLSVATKQILDELASLRALVAAVSAVIIMLVADLVV